MAESIVLGTDIVLPTDTKFGILVNTGFGLEPVKIIKGWEDSVFAVLFESDDVDFLLKVDNCSSSVGIRFTIEISDEYHTFYASPKRFYEPLETIEDNGLNFHFLNQYHSKGSTRVLKLALKHKLDVNSVAQMCSEIKFSIQVEKMAISSRRSIGAINGEKTINLIIVPLSGKDMKFQLCLNDTVATVKNLIETNENVPVDQQLLIYKEKHLTDDTKKLIEYQLKNNSRVVLFIKPGDCQFILPEKEKFIKNNEETELGIRSVCFGKRSHQFFEPYFGFTEDEDYIIKPFTLQLKQKPFF